MIDRQEHRKGQIYTKVLNYAPIIDRALSEDVICMDTAGKEYNVLKSGEKWWEQGH
jgi:hypothetical protein